MIPKQVTYRDRLQPWHLIRHLLNCQRLTVARESPPPRCRILPQCTAPLNARSPAYNCVRKCGVCVG